MSDGRGRRRPTTAVVFNFKVDGQDRTARGAVVAAGHCSPPLVVPVGHGTRSPRSRCRTGSQFVSATATGPTGDSRVVERRQPAHGERAVLQGRTAAARRSSRSRTRCSAVGVKICKLIDPGSVSTSIANLDYRFDVYLNDSKTPLITGGVKPPYPGPAGCVGPFVNTPIVNLDGSPVTLTVLEEAGANYAPSAATVDNYKPGTTPAPLLGSGGISFTPGVGIDVVTITNMWTPKLAVTVFSDNGVTQIVHVTGSGFLANHAITFTATGPGILQNQLNHSPLVTTDGSGAFSGGSANYLQVDCTASPALIHVTATDGTSTALASYAVAACN